MLQLSRTLTLALVASVGAFILPPAPLVSRSVKAPVGVAPNRVGPVPLMKDDPFGFDKVVVDGEVKKLTEYTPQITVLMSVIWIWEYALHHGQSMGGNGWM